MYIIHFILFVALSVHLVSLRFIKSNVQSNSQFWINEAIENIKNKLSQPLNTNVAKNVIFFLGDGMSISTITAARIHQGQLLNKTGEEYVLSFEKFPASGYSKTYCVNQQISDSGSTSTAYMSGVKGNMYTIGVSSDVNLNDCVAAKDPSNRPTTIIKWAQDAGKATGIVTTARITDASPAGGYAHVPSRSMESDQDVLSDKMNGSCDYDIAKQLVRDLPGKNIKVLMGGGTKKLLSKNKTDAFGNAGQRLDTDLIEEWKNDKLRRNFKPKFITNKYQLKELDISGTDYLLGLFSTSHMHFHLEQDAETEPTLEEMTTSAIKLLQKEPHGFFLFVEGALIDKAHHRNQARLAVDETVEFAKAVEAATKLTDEKDTLIVVTADHSQPLIINGYAKRGNDILGITSKDVDTEDERNKKSSKSSKHIKRYFTLNYGNGPGYKTNVESDLANDVDIKNHSYKYPSLYRFSSSHHSGEDVPVYARGPWCHLFNGNYEQTVIPIAEAYAAKIGPSKTIKINCTLHPIGARIIELSASGDDKPKNIENQIHSQDWINDALENIKKKLRQPLNTNRAKNVIFFLGDGMSISTITAARIHEGQLQNKTGEEHILSFEKFPASGYSKTYCVNMQTAESACSATAFMTGVKGNFETIGVTSQVKLHDCAAAKNPSNKAPSIIQWAQDAGKATGIVTTARITHASPAGGYAHVPHRAMESDYDVIAKKMDPSCDFDIARQLVYENPGKNIKVLMGGGIQKLLPKNKTDLFGNPGQRLDIDLIEEWKKDKLERKFTPRFVTTKDELFNLSTSNTDYLLGLFSTSHMHYHLEKTQTEPTLEEMTTAAIQHLQKDANGFFLYVEGALIDKAHHENFARLAIDETIEFAKAIEAATKLTSEEDTLIVVTADHSQPLVMNGFAVRGHDIFGHTYINEHPEVSGNVSYLLNSNLKFFTLNYGNGPGFATNLTSDLINHVHLDNPRYRYPALYPFQATHHAGEDAPVYARGPWSHLFNGNYEQTVIPVAQAYAANIGPSRVLERGQSNNAHFITYGLWWLILAIFVHQWLND